MSTIDTASYNKILSDISNNYVDSTTDEDDASVLGKEDFLKLLIAQMENQDPMNPMESAEYTAQLAQFSSLEQQTNTNDYLAQILGKLGNDTGYNPIDYIGKEIVTVDNSLRMEDGNTPRISYNLEESGTVALIITDESGEDIRRIELGSQEAGDHEFVWDGKDANGESVSNGMYDFSITAVDDKGGDITVDISSSGIVAGISIKGGVTYLDMGGRLVDPQDVVAVRNPNPTS